MRPIYMPSSGRPITVARRGAMYDCDQDGGARVVTSGAPTDPEAETLAAEDVDRMLPSGYWARPPDDTEAAVIETDAGPAVIGERAECPIQLQAEELALCQWDGDAWVKLDSSNVEIHAKSGGKITASAGGITDAVALAQKVAAELSAISAAIAALGGSYSPNPAGVGSTVLETE